MIIFGTRARYKIVGEGQFHCLHCQRERAYVRKQAKNYFALYFIPLFPIGDLGEFIECQTCGRSYAPDVLNFKPSKPQTDTARLLNMVKEKVGRGFPVEHLISDLTMEGIDREIAANIVTMAAGPARRTCPKCELTYAGDVRTCPDCQLLLVDIPSQ